MFKLARGNMESLIIKLYFGFFDRLLSLVAVGFGFMAVVYITDITMDMIHFNGFEQETRGILEVIQPQNTIFEVTKRGVGVSAELGSMVHVKYATYLKRGMKKIDSSLDFSFRLGDGKVILGWARGIIGMRVGEKRKIDVPSRLAFGMPGTGTVVPPYSELIYETELVKLERFHPPMQMLIERFHPPMSIPGFFNCPIILSHLSN